MLAGLASIALVVATALAAEPTLALPPGEDLTAWDEALGLAHLGLAESGDHADLRCRVAPGGWEVLVGEGSSERVLAFIPAPTSPREREELALLAASFLTELGIHGDGQGARLLDSSRPLPRTGAAGAPDPAEAPTQVEVLTVAEPAHPLRLPPAAVSEPPPSSARPISPPTPEVSDPALMTGEERVGEPPAEPSLPPAQEGGVETEVAAAPPPQPASSEGEDASTTPAPELAPMTASEAGLPDPGDAAAPAEPPPDDPPRTPWGQVWLSLAPGVQLQQGVQPGGRFDLGAGLLARQRWWLGLRAGLTGQRTLAALDDQEWVSERELGGVVRFSPAARRIGPALGVTLGNAWRTFSRGAEEPARHCVLVAGIEPGLALSGETWSVGVELRLREDLDRTVLERGGEELAVLSRVQGEAGLTLAWRTKKN